MDAREFLEKFGKEEAMRLARAAGSEYSYFSQIAYGHRKPSAKLARKLVDASGGKLTLVELRPDIYPAEAAA